MGGYGVSRQKYSLTGFAKLQLFSYQPLKNPFKFNLYK